jgi:hypothetical protein
MLNNLISSFFVNQVLFVKELGEPQGTPLLPQGRECDCTSNYLELGRFTVLMSLYEMYTTLGTLVTSVSPCISLSPSSFARVHLFHAIMGRACMYLVMGLDLVGYAEYYQSYFNYLI